MFSTFLHFDKKFFLYQVKSRHIHNGSKQNLLKETVLQEMCIHGRQTKNLHGEIASEICENEVHILFIVHLNVGYEHLHAR